MRTTTRPPSRRTSRAGKTFSVPTTRATSTSTGAEKTSWTGPTCRIAPVDQHRQPVAQRQRLDPVVGHHDGRHAGLLQQVAQLAAQRLAGRGVEGRERLVEQQQPRPRAPGPGPGPPAAAAPRRAAPGRRSQQLGRAPNRSASSATRASRSARGQPVEPVADVGRHREVREEGVVLEEQPDAARLRRHVEPGRGVEPGLAAEGDGAGVGPVQAGQRAQHRGLARAGGAEEDRHRRPLERPGGPRRDGRAAREAAHDLEGQRSFHRKKGRRCSA